MSLKRWFIKLTKNLGIPNKIARTTWDDTYDPENYSAPFAAIEELVESSHGMSFPYSFKDVLWVFGHQDICNSRTTAEWSPISKGYRKKVSELVNLYKEMCNSTANENETWDILALVSTPDAVTTTLIGDERWVKEMLFSCDRYSSDFVAEATDGNADYFSPPITSMSLDVDAPGIDTSLHVASVPTNFLAIRNCS